MIMNNIEVKYDGVVYRDYFDIVVSSTSNTIRLEIGIDGDYTRSDYEYEYLETQRFINVVRENIVSQNNSSILVNISPNELIDNRTNRLHIKCANSDGPGVICCICQNNPIYNITAVPKVIEFNTLLDNTDVNKEEMTVNVCVEGGTGDFIVGRVKEYMKTGEDYVQIPYDKGLKISKIDNKKLVFVNYGKVSLEDEVKYELEIYHRNKKQKSDKITIKYIEPETGFSFGD